MPSELEASKFTFHVSQSAQSDTSVPAFQSQSQGSQPATASSSAPSDLQTGSVIDRDLLTTSPVQRVSSELRTSSPEMSSSDSELTSVSNLSLSDVDISELLRCNSVNSLVPDAALLKILKKPLPSVPKEEPSLQDILDGHTSSPRSMTDFYSYLQGYYQDLLIFL